ncbi:hypothetical protein BO83DRAFT_383121 [Aspergillus eucalypticola CBS 122712]|uniref:Uncharacterized protein n=1 Tax=Aspergillus eucalypticola (strain CBS 122712 / IBT 29274) TaxID=1448314 RepID=A0A317UNZ1_ASPEC|nr:uncharacterized protein BO83DRAFT_383121 [Aspergillus eucalypticola CBS 122712]PWY62878.1 hypothetical protein BO83DRAFT_383121 [Aspergillus eucalypticola CBS 122712]
MTAENGIAEYPDGLDRIGRWEDSRSASQSAPNSSHSAGKLRRNRSLSGEITHDASATAGQAVITALLTGHTECITASRTTDRLLRNPMWPAPPGFAPGTSWAAFRRPSHSVVLAGNEGGPQGVEESGGRSPSSREQH